MQSFFCYRLRELIPQIYIFLLQIQRINTTNIVNISTEFVNSYDRFKNKYVLLEMINDLFSSVRRVISPISRRNSDKAVQLGEVRSNGKLILIESETEKTATNIEGKLLGELLQPKTAITKKQLKTKATVVKLFYLD